jgi:prolyl-tRNA synthetase
MVEAESGVIGGSYSHEFMVLAETGEETIVSCTRCSYGANIEKADFRRTESKGPLPDKGRFKPLQKVLTPDQRTVEEVTQFLHVSPEELVKTLLFDTGKGCVAALIRGDHELSEKKLKNILQTENLQLAGEITARLRKSHMLRKDLQGLLVSQFPWWLTWIFRKWLTSSPAPMKKTLI